MNGWWVVVNPSAGRGRDLTRQVEAALRKRGISFEIRTSASADTIAGLISEGRAEGYRQFGAVGGDGTANLVLNGLLAEPWTEPPTLGILPAGSGSDFVRTFAIPNNLDGGADHFVDGEQYPVDVGLLEGSFGERYFLNAANAGLAARTVVDAGHLPDWLGSRRYLAGFWTALARTKPAPVEVDSDGRTISAAAWNVVVANGQFFGGGMNVAPRAATMDGLFDVQVFSGPRRHAPVVIRRVVRGTHLTHPAVRRTTGGRVRANIPERWMVEADGEIFGTGSFTASVLQGMLNFKI
ncbi:MAG: YegS/Rv2252/BmrU family lipid kinase [Acidimicrobiia bacterium]